MRIPISPYSRCAAILLVALAAVHCGGDKPPGTSSPPPQPPAPDKVAPVIVARTPEPDSENVWAGAPIRVVFSEPLARQTFTESAVTVQSEEGPLAAQVSLADGEREIRVLLKSPRLGPTRLTATIATGLTDAAGNGFAGATWSWSIPFWQQPGSAPAVSAPGPLRPAVALDSGQNPVIAWQETLPSGAAVRVARLADGRWQSLGARVNLRPDGAAAAAKVAVARDDRIIVAWQEVSDATHVFVKRSRGDQWDLLGGGAVDAGVSREGTQPVVTLDPDGVPVVAWIEDNARVRIRRWNESSWLPVADVWNPGASIEQIDFAFDGANPVLAVAVATALSTDVRVVRWQPSSGMWESVGPSLDRAIDDKASRPSLAVSGSGLIAVAWQENDGFSDNVYAARYDAMDGKWKVWGSALDLDFDAPAINPSLKLAASGTPLVSWSEGGEASARTCVARWAGERWDVPGVGLNVDPGRSSKSTALAVDGAGDPVVVWEERAPGSAGASELLAKRFNGSPTLPYGLSERSPAPCSFPPDGATDFPRLLSQTNCFTDVARRTPARGLIPYDVNSPLWSDGALKRRFLILPEGAVIGFTEDDAWRLPVGTILVKEFLLQRESGNAASIFPVETRFIVKRCEPGLCRAAWQGYSYQWNDDGSEATLLDNDTTTIFKDWTIGGQSHRHGYPGREECTQCHANAAGGVLGLQTGQLNRNHDYGAIVDNQLRALDHIGVFGDSFRQASMKPLAHLPTPSDAAYTNNERVRSYFHSNCSHCHRSDGRWPVIDFRYDSPLGSANICDELVPGDAEVSRIFIKDSAREPDLPPDFFGLPMPPLASLLPDRRQLPVLKTWINEMKSCP